MYLIYSIPHNSLPMTCDSHTPTKHLLSILFLSFKILQKTMVVDKMLLWLEVLSIHFPAQLMGTPFPTSHGIVKLEQYIVDSSSKQVKVGATLVQQETFMGYQATSHSAWSSVSLIYFVAQGYVTQLSLVFQAFSAIGPNILHSELVEVEMIWKW